MSPITSQIRPFLPTDAEQVPALFGLVYGDTYPVGMVYDPEALKQAQREGTYFPFGAHGPQGQLIAYGALYQSTPNPGIYEFGQGAVHPDQRGSGLGRLLFEFVAQYAPTLPGSEMYFGEAVCNHTTTQKAGALIQTLETGLEVDLLPGSSQGPVSVVDMFRTFVPRPHRVYLPKVYEDILRWIYQGFDDGRTQQLAPEQAPSAEATRLHTQVFASAGVVRIQVRQAGLDFETLLDRELADLVAKSPRVVQVWLSLTDPAIERHVASLRLRGFFFGGLFPRWFGEDGMLLQKVMGTPHWEGIRIYSERSKEILRFIRDDWSKCSQEGSGHE